MCGIAGFQGDFEATLLARMTRVVSHRGPDGEGMLYIEDPIDRQTVGLGHRRLSIIDLSDQGCQPMSVGCASCGSAAPGDLVLVYNGEIYNYRELRSELEARGHRFHSGTDSEVLLHLYAESGLGMVERLNGIFAFALYDGRERGRPTGVERGDVFLARDPLGVKPLYLTQLAEGVLFASELKALLQHGAVSREIDHHAVAQTLAYLWTPAPRTALQAVRKVPPGNGLVLRQGRISRQWGFYELPYGEPVLTGSERQIAEELHDRLEEAVRRQMVADVPVGAFLSGGLDSSAVVAMMKRVEPGNRPRCYSIGFRDDASMDGAAPDLPYARRVARHLDVDLHELRIGPDSIDQLERMLYFLDEPQADPAPINALLICEQAAADGIKVLLSGAGGDDIFSGYRRHHALHREWMWTGLPTPARRLLAGTARRARAGSLGGWMDSVRVRRLAKLFANADRTEAMRLVSYFWWNDEALRQELLAPPLTSLGADVAVAEPMLRSLDAAPSARDGLSRMLLLETKHFLADHNLNYTDKVGMAAGVEVRVPLLDLDLVRFAARVPSSMKQRGSVGKAIFKRAMEPHLPHDVIYRPKTGFGAPLRGWLRNELRDAVDDTLSEASLRRRGIFEPAAVRRLLELERAGRVEGTYTVFALMCIELWCRMFVDATPGDVGSAGATPVPTVRLSTCR